VYTAMVASTMRLGMVSASRVQLPAKGLVTPLKPGC